MPDPIERVKNANGELVLDYDSRIGARPYARYVNGEWDLMSLTYVPTPEYGKADPDADHGINTRVHTVNLEPDPEEWDESDLREMAKQPRHQDDVVKGWPGVSVISFEDSPFPDREEIPARDDIVRDRGCTDCGKLYREYIPEPQSECPYCGAKVDTQDGEDQ